MKKKITILFPCIGRRVALLKCFRQAARKVGIQCNIIGTDVSDLSPALLCCDIQNLMPPVDHPHYMRETLKVIRKHKVDLVVPTIDLDLSKWATWRNRLAKEGCTVLISSTQAVETCQDKRKMYRFLRTNGFDTPETFTVTEALKKKRHRFPYFLKPWDGHASRGNAMVYNKDELTFFGRRIPNCLVQEYVDDQEYTIDVFVDIEGQVRCVTPRKRIEARSGEVSKGQMVRHQGIMDLSKKLIDTLQAGPGVVTIQCFLDKQDKIKIIEVNPRFGGGVPLSIKAGADFPTWILKQWVGQTPRYGDNKWRDGLLMTRYDEAVWVTPG
jgi:carbamoyl-phosphate synthase large subunit